MFETEFYTSPSAFYSSQVAGKNTKKPAESRRFFPLKCYKTGVFPDKRRKGSERGGKGGKMPSGTYCGAVHQNRP
jgi:hypothetical protein